MPLDEFHTNLVEVEAAADRIIQDQMSLMDIELWLNWKGRRKADEVTEKAIICLLEQVKEYKDRCARLAGR